MFISKFSSWSNPSLILYGNYSTKGRYNRNLELAVVEHRGRGYVSKWGEAVVVADLLTVEVKLW